MNIQDIMIDDFGVVPDSAHLQQAAALMQERGANILAVQQGERIVGTLSLRDLAFKGCAEGRDPRGTPVETVMTPTVAISPLETDLVTALRLMDEKGVDALLLGEAPEKAVGMVTRRQVLEELAHPDVEARGPQPEQVNRVRGNPV